MGNRPAHASQPRGGRRSRALVGAAAAGLLAAGVVIGVVIGVVVGRATAGGAGGSAAAETRTAVPRQGTTSDGATGYGTGPGRSTGTGATDPTT